MKFSTIFAFVVATYATVSSAAPGGGFQAQNAADAENLTKQFAKLTPNSPCTNGQNACVQGQFAQCVNGKFALTPCSGGTQCTVLPLVNKPGTSVTCDTAADQAARLAAAKGTANTAAAAPATPATPAKNNDSGNGNSTAVNGNNGMNCMNGTNTSNNGTSASNKGTNASDNGTNASNNGTNASNNGTSANAAGNSGNSASGGNKGFQAQNAADAENLTKQFAKLTPNSPCTNGQNACVQGQFAQCVNGKFALTPCSGGTQCTVLPLVNKPGTSVTCDTAADQAARLAAAKGTANKRQANGSLAATRKLNAADAIKLNQQFQTLNANSPCTTGQNACVGNKFAQCSNGKFATTSCASGEVCAALPLVLKRGTSVTCTTAADRDARISAAQQGQ